MIYETEGDSYNDAIHMELKRDYSSHEDSSDRSTSLFEEYQYFTPGLCCFFTNYRSITNLLVGIFMGLIATFLFFFILYIGINALSSLQVPYAAFEKDTSAAVQKKAQ